MLISKKIRRIDRNGIITTFAGTLSGPQETFNDGDAATSVDMVPQGLAMATDGSLLVADTNHYRILKISTGTNPTVSLFAGSRTKVRGYDGDGRAATTALMNGPSNMTVAKDGTVYVSDIQRIRRISPDGIIHLVAGGTCGFSGDEGSAIAAEICGPLGMALDEGGTLYFADNGNHVFRKITQDGIIHAFAGISPPSGEGSYTGDGRPALSAGFNSPWDIALGLDGSLFFARSKRTRRT